MQLQGKTALITGAAKRVGRVIALTLARRGAHCIITYQHSEKEAQATTQEIESLGVRARALRLDQSRASEVKDAVAQATAAFGGVDVLVNNASVFFRTPFPTLTEEAWDRTLQTNLKGPFLLSHALGQQMMARGAGKIVNIGDWAGVRPYIDYLPYCVSKAGVIALTKALAISLAPQVQVNCVCPGPVLLPEEYGPAEQAEILAGTPLKRLGTPEDVANSIAFLIEGSDFITGAVLMVDGGRLIAG